MTGALASLVSGAAPASASATASQVSAGGYHTCAVTTHGAAQCWGANWDGQLGDGSGADQGTPVGVSGLASGVVQITAGDEHTCALTTAGGVKCWGYGDYGQIGDGSGSTYYVPVDVAGLTSGVVQIAAGALHTCALTTAGGVKCWGYGGEGQLGDGSGSNYYVPVDVAGLTSGVAAITAGGSHTCALTTAGGVKCWGYGGDGELGTGSSSSYYTPVNVSGMTSGAAAVTAGADHTCALTTAGAVKCWGYNGAGELGDGTSTTRYTPVFAIGLTSGVNTVDAGSWHTCAVTSSGDAKCWGQGSDGQLGNGSSSNRYSPTDVFGLTSGAASVSAGGYHSCAVLSSGAVECWGDNGDGQVGDGSWSTRYVPAAVSLLGTPPGAPTNVAATAGNASITVSFSAPTDTGTSAISSYTAECSSSNGGTYGNASGSGSPIVVSSLSNGFTYTCTVFATNADGSGPTSAASNAVVPSNPVVVSLGGTSLYEGDSGSHVAEFAVTLSNPSTSTVSVSYSVFKGSSDTATPGVDFVATTGTLTFSPVLNGKTPTVAFIPVTIKGDTTSEANESFSVSLTGASGATIGRSLSRATIFNDDPQSGQHVSISNAGIVEGNTVATVGGANSLHFHLSLARPVPSGKSVTVKYTVTGGSATGCSSAGAGCDFQQTTSPVTVTFTAGQLDKTISVKTFADTTPEPDETFVVTIVSASGATLRNSQGTGTIRNDD